MTRSKFGQWLAGAAYMAVVGTGIYGVYWLGSEWFELSKRLSPSTNVSSSTSMELYEINLRRMEVDAEGKETGRVLEWKLAVPRALLFDESGENGNSYSITDYSATSYSFSLAIQISEDLKEFSPNKQIGGNGKLPRDMLLSSSNVYTPLFGTSTGFIVANDLCVRDHERGAAAKKVGMKSTSIECDERTYRCMIYSQIDGWRIGAMVTKDLYAEPETTCSKAKEFLNRFTVKRDRDVSLNQGKKP